MGLISYAIPHLFNGVSQQPDSLRHPTQVEAQDNCWVDLAIGLGKRPPSNHVAQLNTDTGSTKKHHFINQSATSRYVVELRNGAIKVYDLTGVEKTVSTPDGLGYLAVSSPVDDYFCTTIADTTIVMNRSVVTAMGSATTSGTLKGTKQRYEDLPTSGMAAGDVWKIVNQPNVTSDDYYVIWDAAGVWLECAAPGIAYQLDATTMPHILVDNKDGTFTFKKASWGERAVGDTSSVPDPSFVGNTLTAAFFHRGRLGIISGENVVLSRAGNHFNFWPSTVTSVPADDPIDVSMSHNKSSVLAHAVPFNGSLMLFSEQTQFQLSGGEALTPSNAKLDPTTEFETDIATMPVGAGQDLYFVTTRGNNSGMRQYYVEKDTITNDAANLTAHVPQYLPKNVFKMAVTTALDAVFLVSKDTPNIVYQYKFAWKGDENIQSSWGRIVLDSTDTILTTELVNTKLYLVIRRADGTYLEYIDFHTGTTDSTLGFLVHLDRKVTLTGVYDIGTNTTTWTLPYSDSGVFQVALGAAFGSNTGAVVTTTKASDTTLTATGDFSAGIAYVGRVYTKRVELSKQYPRDSQGSAITGNKLMMKTMDVTYVDTGYFTVHVTPEGRDPYTYTFTGKTLGTLSAMLGSTSLASGVFRFPVVSSSRNLSVVFENNSIYPSFFQSVEWEAMAVSRSRRL